MTTYHVAEYNLTYTDEEVLYLLYTNWRGETSWRRVVPLPRILEFKNKLLKKEGKDVVSSNLSAWVLRVYDLDRKAERSYVLTNIRKMRSLPTKECLTCFGYKEVRRNRNTGEIHGAITSNDEIVPCPYCQKAEGG